MTHQGWRGVEHNLDRRIGVKGFGPGIAFAVTVFWLTMSLYPFHFVLYPATKFIELDVFPKLHRLNKPGGTTLELTDPEPRHKRKLAALTPSTSSLLHNPFTHQIH